MIRLAKTRVGLTIAFITSLVVAATTSCSSSLRISVDVHSAYALPDDIDSGDLHTEVRVYLPTDTLNCDDIAFRRVDESSLSAALLFERRFDDNGSVGQVPEKGRKLIVVVVEHENDETRQDVLEGCAEAADITFEARIDVELHPVTQLDVNGDLAPLMRIAGQDNDGVGPSIDVVVKDAFGEVLEADVEVRQESLQSAAQTTSVTKSGLVDPSLFVVDTPGLYRLTIMSRFSATGTPIRIDGLAVDDNTQILVDGLAVDVNDDDHLRLDDIRTAEIGFFGDIPVVALAVDEIVGSRGLRTDADQYVALVDIRDGSIHATRSVGDGYCFAENRLAIVDLQESLETPSIILQEVQRHQRPTGVEYWPCQRSDEDPPESSRIVLWTPNGEQAFDTSDIDGFDSGDLGLGAIKRRMKRSAVMAHPCDDATPGALMVGRSSSTDDSVQLLGLFVSVDPANGIRSVDTAPLGNGTVYNSATAAGHLISSACLRRDIDDDIALVQMRYIEQQGLTYNMGIGANHNISTAPPILVAGGLVQPAGFFVRQDRVYFTVLTNEQAAVRSYLLNDSGDQFVDETEHFSVDGRVLAMQGGRLFADHDGVVLLVHRPSIDNDDTAELVIASLDGESPPFVGHYPLACAPGDSNHSLPACRLSVLDVDGDDVDDIVTVTTDATGRTQAYLLQMTDGLL